MKKPKRRKPGKRKHIAPPLRRSSTPSRPQRVKLTHGMALAMMAAGAMGKDLSKA